MQKSNRRVDIRAILKDPKLRESIMIQCIISIQAREGITTTVEQAKKAWLKVLKENKCNI